MLVDGKVSGVDVFLDTSAVWVVFVVSAIGMILIAFDMSYLSEFGC